MLPIKGYKSAHDFIIQLNITSPFNNLSRRVEDKNYAKYRCDQAYVDKIYNKFTKHEIDCIQSDFDNNFIYKKGQYVFVNNYDHDINNICTNGIHFYLSEEAAFFHNIKDYIYINEYTGIYKEWDNDGQTKIWLQYDSDMDDDNGILC